MKMFSVSYLTEGLDWIVLAESEEDAREIMRRHYDENGIHPSETLDADSTTVDELTNVVYITNKFKLESW